jgi:hypothetical protein
LKSAQRSSLNGFKRKGRAGVARHLGTGGLS